MKLRFVARVLFVLTFLPFFALAADATSASTSKKIRIVLVGDSTVTDSAGWGLGFRQFIDPVRIELVNTAMGGRSSMSFMKEGRWEKALALHADYYLVQFGHNNEPGKPGRSTDMPTYIADMNRYVDEGRASGAHVVLVTPLTRRQWDSKNPGKIASSLTPYSAEVKKVAEEKKVPLIDLHDRSRSLCESFGAEKCLDFSPTKTSDGKVVPDHTHLNGKGSVLFARIVVEELIRVVPELAGDFRKEPLSECPVSDSHHTAAEDTGDSAFHPTNADPKK